PGHLRQRHLTAFARFNETGESTVTGKVMEVEGLRKGNVAFPVELAVNSFNIRGETLFIGSIRDITERRKTEEEIRKNTDRLKNVQHMAKIGSWELCLSTGEVVFRSDEVYAIFGVAQEDPGRAYEAFLDLVHPEDREAVRESVKEALRLKRPYSIDYRIKRPDGAELHMHEEAEVVFDNGVPIALAGAVQDISERKRVENQLRAINRTLTMVTECNQSLIRATDESELLKEVCGIIVGIGGYRMAWVGYAEHDESRSVRPMAVAGHNEGYVENVNISWADTERGKGPSGRAIRTGRPVVASDIAGEPDYIWSSEAAARGYASSIALPILIGAKVLGSLNIYAGEANAFDQEEVNLLIDLTGDLAYGISALRVHAEHRTAEEALKRSEEKYRTLFEESRDVIFICSADKKELDINTAGLDLFGFSSRDEMLKLNFPQDICFNPEERWRFERELTKKGFINDLELVLKRKDSKPVYALISANIVRGHKGEISAYRGIIHDMTGYKNLEQQLLQAQKMEAIGQLTGGIAHDFNNLLTTIMNSASLLEMDLDRSGRSMYYVQQIQAAAQSAATLTRSLLAFSRRQIMEVRPVNLNDVITNVQKLLSRMIGEDVDLEFSPAPYPLPVMADIAQLEQVLMNLAANSRDAMPEGGRLSISTKLAEIDNDFIKVRGFGKAGEYAVINVSDTGTGIDEAAKGKIFEPFFTTKEVGKGTGLGLSIVYGIIKQHGGYINVESSPGNGASFTIYMPLIESRAVKSEIKAPAPLARGSETLLLAEDDKAVRTLIKITLERCGYKVIEAADGEDAINKFMENQNSIELIILDVIMPRKNGKEAYNEIRKARPGIRAIFTSGYNEEIIHKKGILEEGLNFVSKPVVP
ncbi:MAG: PAS domain S-box protein, partial [Deltaproteobacteria bacterium]